ncbi:MAG: DUF3322 domain-containing protein, partial [Spirochaetaceae bacterium]|nr:DUF3322 domain-containing protein [Spirochaetaceae bacterium]
MRSMKMLSPEDIRRKSERRFTAFLLYKLETEVFHRSAEAFFPWEIPAGRDFHLTTSSAVSGVAQALGELRRRSKEIAGTGYSLVFETVETRKLSTQTVLKKAVFETEQDYLSFLKQKQGASRFLENARVVYSRFPDCEEWLRNNTSRLLDRENGKAERRCWEDICLCVQCFLDHPASGLYIREIPLPVHTKFIESHKNDILSLFRFLLRSRSDNLGSEAASFEDELGLRQDEPFIRFRTAGCDIGLPLSVFAVKPPADIREVFVIENKMVYLTFPRAEGRLCIFGSGFQVTALSCCRWLLSLDVYYFGDLDEHGFAILSLFRGCFPHVRSFCMNMQTLEEFGEFRVPGKAVSSETLANLTEEEGGV